MGKALVLCLVFLLAAQLASGFRSVRSSKASCVVIPKNGVCVGMAGGFDKTEITDSEPKFLDAGKSCPCGSEKKYGECCAPFHTGAKKPDTIVEMVRSRFSALAVSNTAYLQETTHPSNKEFVPEDRKGKRSKWRKSLNEFARVYNFEKLDFSDEEGQAVSKSGKNDGDTAEVEFTATLQPVDFPDRNPEMMNEVSTFTIKDGNWLYSLGKVNDFDVKARPVKEQKSTRMITTRKIGVSGNN